MKTKIKIGLIVLFCVEIKIKKKKLKSNLEELRYVVCKRCKENVTLYYQLSLVFGIN